VSNDALRAGVKLLRKVEFTEANVNHQTRLTTATFPAFAQLRFRHCLGPTCVLPKKAVFRNIRDEGSKVVEGKCPAHDVNIGIAKAS
jgi:hypothetical protein